MVKIIKYFKFFSFFSTILTVLFLSSCSNTFYQNKPTETKLISIDNSLPETDAILDYIAPYKAHINKDLDSVLCFNPETLDKSKGKWQTNIGNFFAITCYQEAAPIFEKRFGKKIDLCLLNHGGIRAVIPKGTVSARNAFEIMPFENDLVVVEISKTNLEKLLNYIVSEKKPHPLYGVNIILSEDEKEIINYSLLNSDRNKDSFYVLTSDYLSTGGDNMNFFLEPIKNYEIDYKLRNVFIDYFKKVDTLPIFNQTPIQVFSKN